VKIAGVTFSPDRQRLWYLVEAQNAKVRDLAGLSIITNSASQAAKEYTCG
jgi:hypothetical protein